MKVLLLGGTGTIGSATACALRDAGHEVVALVRSVSDTPLLSGCTVVSGHVTKRDDLENVFAHHNIGAVLSCIASRSGVAKDAWAIDYHANRATLELAKRHGVKTFVLLSAICVQKPRLAFQKAKLAFEAELQASDLTWSIVRPTAYFKSLSGQIDRLRRGKPFLVFGDGTLTSCKPISNSDLAQYLVGCLEEPSRQNKVLPIGGPGPALTPAMQGELLFKALALEPKFKQVPPGVLSGIAAGLSVPGRFFPYFEQKAELARIGHYYATESMLVWDAVRSLYDADATPEFGSDDLEAHFQQLTSSRTSDARGDHAVF